MKYAILLIILFSPSLFAAEIFSKTEFLDKKSIECEKEYLLTDWEISNDSNNTEDTRIINHLINNAEYLQPSSIRLIGYADKSGGTGESIRAAGRRLEKIENLISEKDNNLKIYSYSPKGMKHPPIQDGKNQRTVSFTLQSCKTPALKFAAAKKDGVYYKVAEEFEEKSHKTESLNYPFELISTNGSSAILNLLDEGKADLGFATETSIINKSKNSENFQPIFEVWRDYIFFITTDKFVGEKDADHIRLTEIINQNPDKICFGVEGSSTQLAAKNIFDSLKDSLETHDLKSACNTSNSEYSNKEQLKKLGKGEYALVVISVAHPADVLLDALEINEYTFTNDGGGFKIIDFTSTTANPSNESRHAYDFPDEPISFKKDGCKTNHDCFSTYYEKNYLVSSEKTIKENKKIIISFIEEFFKLSKKNENHYLTQARDRACSQKDKNKKIFLKDKDLKEILETLCK